MPRLTFDAAGKHARRRDRLVTALNHLGWTMPSIVWNRLPPAGIGAGRKIRERSRAAALAGMVTVAPADAAVSPQSVDGLRPVRVCHSHLNRDDATAADRRRADPQQPSEATSRLVGRQDRSLFHYFLPV